MSARIRERAIVGALVMITLAIYAPNLGSHFVNWDYGSYEKVLHSDNFWGMAWELLTDFQGRIVPGYYAPLCSVSLLADKFLIGSGVPQPWWTHLINVLIHCLNGVLVYILIRKVGGTTGVASLAALIFLVHPIQTGAILWFAGRKTVLACAFYLLTFLAYLNYRRDGSLRWMSASLAVFCLGQLSKPTVSVFPLMILVTEVTLCRAGFWRSCPDGRSDDWVPWSPARVICSALPFVVISAGLSLMALDSEAATVNLDLVGLPYLHRPFNAAAAIWFYVGKIVFPVDLTPLYPRWQVDLASIWWWLPLVALICAAGLVLHRHERLPGIGVWALANFLVPLLPVLGLVKFGFLMFSYVSNHLVYLSMVGACHALSLAMHELYRRCMEVASHRAQIPEACAIATPPQFQDVGERSIEASQPESGPATDRPPALAAEAPEHGRFLPLIGYGRLSALFRRLGRGFRSCLLVITGLGARDWWADRDAGPYESVTMTRVRSTAPHLRSGELRPAWALALVLLMGGYVAFLGVQAERQSRIWHDSVSLWTYVTDKNPSSWRAMSYLGGAFSDAGKPQDAVHAYTRAVQLRPNFSVAYFELGLALKKAGDLQGAIRAYTKAIALDPRHVEAHSNVGLALIEAGKIPEAIEHLAAALTVDPTDAVLYYHMGLAQQTAGDHDSAMKWFQQALDLNRSLAAAHARLAALMLEKGDLPGAAERLKAAVDLEPRSASHRGDLAMVLKKQGLLHEAIAHYEEALKIAPRAAETHNNLGLAFEQLGRFTEAAGHFRVAAEIRPDLADPHLNLGNVLLKSGRLQEAELAYGKAVKIRPDFAEAHNNLGVALEAMGRIEEAVSQFREALAYRPDYAQAKDNLQLALKKSKPSGTKPTDPGQSTKE
ncbi:MAG: tetratricopeptide repeat protein [Thermodesulfobacteriota bacterium]